MFIQKISENWISTRAFISQQISKHYRAIIIGFAVLFTLVAGLSGIFLPTNFAPLLVGLVLVAGLAVLILLVRPSLAWYLAVLIVFIPDGILEAQIQSYLNRGMVVAVFAFWLVTSLLDRKKIVIPPASWFLLGFLLWGLISLFWIKNFDQGQENIQSYILRWLLFLFLSVNLIDSWKKVNGLMNMLALVGLILVLASFISVLLNGYTPGTRLKVFGMNENGTGILLLTAFTGVLWWADQPEKRHLFLRRFLAIGYLAITIVLIALSGSRGSAISLLVTLLMFWFWKSTRKWAIMAVILLIFAALVGSFLFSTIIERFSTSGLYGDTTLGGREGLWQAAWLMIRDHPVLGVGIGDSDLAIMPYFSDISIEPSILPRATWTSEDMSIHSPILTILADVGVIGLVLYLGVLVSAVVSFIRTFMSNKNVFLQRYFPLVASIFIGYMASWVKGGGMEVDHSYFLMITMLLLPGVILSREKQKPKDTLG